SLYLGGYASRFWGYHLSKATEPEKAGLLEAASAFCSGPVNRVEAWFQRYNFLNYPDAPSTYFPRGSGSLHIAVKLGIESLVRYRIKQGDDLEQRNNDGCTPYMIASIEEEEKIKKILIDAGASTSMLYP